MTTLAARPATITVPLGWTRIEADVIHLDGTPCLEECCGECAADERDDAEIRRRALPVGLALQALSYGDPVADDSVHGLVEVLEEGRGWISDIGYTGDAWALSSRSVARIIRTHCEGGCAAFALMAEPLIPDGHGCAPEACRCADAPQI